MEMEEWLQTQKAKKVYVIDPALEVTLSGRKTLWAQTKQFRVKVYEDTPFIMMFNAGVFAVLVDGTLHVFPMERLYGVEVEGDLKEELLDSVYTSYKDAKGMLEAARRSQEEGQKGL